MVSRLAFSSFRSLSFAPAGNVAEAVFPGLDAKILADRVGNAFRLDFFRALVLSSLFDRRQISFTSSRHSNRFSSIYRQLSPAAALFCLCLGSKALVEVPFCASVAYHYNLQDGSASCFFGSWSLLCATSWTAAETVCTSLIPSRMAIRC